MVRYPEDGHGEHDCCGHAPEKECCKAAANAAVEAYKEELGCAQAKKAHHAGLKSAKQEIGTNLFIGLLVSYFWFSGPVTSTGWWAVVGLLASLVFCAGVWRGVQQYRTCKRMLTELPTLQSSEQEKT
ncbi:MAG: hypothetical protein Q7S52_00670 [bacterium]|nr:hypothetical protein [bacterium]